MVIKLSFWGCLLSLGCILLTGCPKECINITHSYSAQFFYSPNKKQYAIGDTLWLENTFSCKSQLNSVTGKIEEFCGAINLGTTLGITSLLNTTTSKEVDAVDSFTFVNLKGRIYSAGTDAQKKFVKQIKFEQSDTNYTFKCGIIPLKKGIYYFGIGNAINVIRNDKSDCEKAGYSFTVGNNMNNIEIYFAHRGSTEISEYEKPRGYWFEVK